jgi:hypothetical protein
VLSCAGSIGQTLKPERDNLSKNRSQEMKVFLTQHVPNQEKNRILSNEEFLYRAMRHSAGSGLAIEHHGEFETEFERNNFGMLIRGLLTKNRVWKIK